jgi:hypothetical protein
MGKPKAKQEKQKGGFFKWLITNVRSIMKIISLTTVAIVVVAVVIVIIISAKEKATIEISFGEGLRPTIRVIQRVDTGGNTKSPGLESAIEQNVASEGTYDQLRSENEQLRRKCDSLEAEKERNENFWVSFVKIWVEIRGNVNINTNAKAPAGEESKKRETYKHIQRILSTVGFQEGEINGSQEATCTAVKLFQIKNNLKEDGIVGPKTWNVIIDKIEDCMGLKGLLSKFKF